MSVRYPDAPSRSEINHARDVEGNSYLHQLCAADAAPEKIEYAILALGANVDLCNKKGHPPLATAIQHASASTVDLLIRHGARLFFDVGAQARDEESFNAILCATQTGRLQAFEIVLKKGGAEYINRAGISTSGLQVNTYALHEAVERGHIYMINRLIEQGAFKDQPRGSEEITPVILAAKLDMRAALEELVNKGADVRRTDAKGWTALHYAAELIDESALRLLVLQGADLDAMTRQGETPLICAVRLGRIDCVRCLLDAGADIDARQKSEAGRTPLMIAAGHNNQDMVKLLLARGANPTLTDAFNRAASAFVDDARRSDLKSLLKEHEDQANRSAFEKAYRQSRKSA